MKGSQTSMHSLSEPGKSLALAALAMLTKRVLTGSSSSELDTAVVCPIPLSGCGFIHERAGFLGAWKTGELQIRELLLYTLLNVQLVSYCMWF